MDNEEIERVLSRGYALEKRERKIDEEYLGVLSTDGLSFYHQEFSLDDKKEIRSMAKAILENMESVQTTLENNKEIMSAEGDEWKNISQ